MNKHIPPTEALDEQERELARIVRALPGGEPPPALDARILKAAANAAATTRRPGARWLASAGALWGIGGAAAAVLALGVSWHSMFPMPRTSRPDTAPAAAMADETEDSGVPVEFKDREAPRYDNGPPPPPAPAVARSEPRNRMQAASPPPPPPPPASAPEPFASDALDEHVAAAAEAQSAEDFASAAREKSNADEAIAARAATEKRNSDQAMAAKASSTAAQERDATLARQAQPVAAAPAPPTVADSGLAASGAVASTEAASTPPMRPATWLARVRRLRDSHRLTEARASLKEFHRTHPQYVIPPDLAPLLRE